MNALASSPLNKNLKFSPLAELGCSSRTIEYKLKSVDWGTECWTQCWTESKLFLSCVSLALLHTMIFLFYYFFFFNADTRKKTSDFRLKARANYDDQQQLQLLWSYITTRLLRLYDKSHKCKAVKVGGNIYTYICWGWKSN